LAAGAGGGLISAGLQKAGYTVVGQPGAAQNQTSIFVIVHSVSPNHHTISGAALLVDHNPVGLPFELVT
jgi:hypothetical protein